jgi:hypothetical protein
MYRGSQESHIETIARLETELAELRALHAPAAPRARVLWGITALSVVGIVLAAAASASAHARSERLERRMTLAASLLESKRQDLTTCEQMVQSEQLRLQQQQARQLEQIGEGWCDVPQPPGTMQGFGVR